MVAVLLQGVADGRFEVVDGDEVGEEGQDVLDLNEVARSRQAVHGRADVVLLLNDVTGATKPDLAASVVVAGVIQATVGEVRVNLRK